MTRTSALSLRTPIWALLAVAVALLIGTQPYTVVVAAGSLAAFVILGLITPISAFAVLLILAPLRTLVATEAPGSLPLDIGQIALIALICCWFAYRIAHGRTFPHFHWSPIYVPLFSFIAITALTAFEAVAVSDWLGEWLKWVQIALLVAFCLDLGAWEWLIFALVLAGAANAVIGIYEYFGGSGALHLVVNGDHFRAFGTFGQPNPFGGFMGLIAPVALLATLGYSVRVLRLWRDERKIAFEPTAAVLFYGLSTAAIIAALIFSWSRGAWLGFAAAAAAMLLALPRKWWYGAAIVAVAAVLVGTLWVAGRLPESIVSRIESATDEIVAVRDARGVDVTPENYANVERLAHWQAAINMAQANPFLGVGFGNYEAAYSQYNLLNWRLALGHAHNYYLNVFAEAGMIGLVAYIGLWMTVIALTWRARSHPDPLARLIVIGLLGTWTYLTVHSLTDNLYVNNLFLHVGALLGVLAVLGKIQCVRME